MTNMLLHKSVSRGVLALSVVGLSLLLTSCDDVKELISMLPEIDSFPHYLQALLMVAILSFLAALNFAALFGRKGGCLADFVFAIALMILLPYSFFLNLAVVSGTCLIVAPIILLILYKYDFRYVIDFPRLWRKNDD